MTKMTKNDKNDKNDKMANKQRDIQIKRQKDRECGPATKYFSISGFHYFLSLNNLVQNARYNRMYLETHLS